MTAVCESSEASRREARRLPAVEAGEPHLQEGKRRNIRRNDTVWFSHREAAIVLEDRWPDDVVVPMNLPA